MSNDLFQLVHNNVRKRIADGEVAVSMVVRLVTSVEIANIAGACGFDSLYVDLEHSSLSLETTSQICIAALDAGIAPFVRVPTHGSEYVSRALDGGALGIIAPHVATAEEARQVVSNAKFPPLGNRSVTVGIPHLRFRNWPAAEARRILNQETMVIAMIETPDALDNVEEIAAVEGVDIVMIGTNDLCAEMGIDGQFEHEKVAAAYTRTIEACRRHGKAAGIGGLAGKPDLLRKFIAEGARYVSSGADLSFILQAGKARASEVRAMPTKT
ncbi:aldolase/citrate lyase family protein [soil metagenome]